MEPVRTSTLVIPPFGANGKLPLGRHAAGAAEVEGPFVQVFARSITRPGIYAGWRDRRHELFDLVPVVTEWVDGSFVTAKADPGDIDVVSFVEADLLDALSETDKRRIVELMNRDRSKLAFGCDGFLVAIRPPGHPLRPIFETWAAYWQNVWSHDRDGSEKGYLEVTGTP